ncbi:MAG: DUF5106 domain-containing protein [Duncaniella sp.]|uniref:DUF5106 domain-containing protein n=1 Tax=Duncaniella sp. TaxID=2518496 RepID=UPI0023CE4BB1|nr:DUF5106 domain-containing protein [Duncaniella sp.]MDE6090793.1 DUF5106 domain-containing protein [Duncaniella sp.]
MKLKALLLGLLLSLGISFGAKADTYFQYPLIPDSINIFQSRCDYLARHFWDFCDMKKAFSAKSRMAEEFKVYISILKNATPDSAIASVVRFNKQLEKQPADQLFMAECAENLLYGDTAEVWIDELYLPFAHAIASNKRIDKASKARFAHQEKILKNSLVRFPAPSIPYTTREGASGNLDNDSAQVVVVFFNDPDCEDCNMARIRLDADISMTELIQEGKAKVVSISLTDPTPEWKEAVSSYPSTWVVAASPDADMNIDLRAGTPEFYILDRKHNIHFKHLGINQVLDVARQLKKR